VPPCDRRVSACRRRSDKPWEDTPSRLSPLDQGNSGTARRWGNLLSCFVAAAPPAHGPETGPR
jgi:hypothetical protein